MAIVNILFGEMGAGKNYHGENLSKALDVPFVDGDIFVTPEMVERVSQFKPLTQEMVTKYVNRLAGNIVNLIEEKKCDEIIIGQALYRDADRLFIEQFLNCFGHQVQWFWIKTPFLRNAKQLLTRPKGWRWVVYWLTNKPFFQTPTHKYHILDYLLY